MGRGLSPAQEQVLLIARAAKSYRATDVSHAELMTARYGWSEPASAKFPGYEVAHASMARTLARLRARGLLRRRGGRIQLTTRGESAARDVVTARGPVNEAHAVHEAGHTVVAIALGLRVAAVHVVPVYCTGVCDGGATTAFSEGPDQSEAARNDIRVAWGGVCAEHVVLGASIDKQISGGSAEQDYAELSKIASEAGISSHEVGGLRADALRIVRAGRRKVKRLVKALATHLMISGRDAAAICERGPK